MPDQGLFGYILDIDNNRIVAGSTHSLGVGSNLHILERDHGGINNWGLVQLMTDTMLTTTQTKVRFWDVDIQGETIVFGPGVSSIIQPPGEAIVLKKGFCDPGRWDIIRRIQSSEFTTNVAFNQTGRSNVILNDQILVGVHSFNHPGVSGFSHGAIMVMKYDSYEPVTLCQTASVVMEEDGDVDVDVNDLVDINDCWYTSISTDVETVTCEDGNDVLVTMTMTDNNNNLTTCETYIHVFDEFGTCCPDTLIVQTSPVQNKTYTADFILESDLIIDHQDHTVFQALKNIDLNPGFEVKANTRFVAKPRGCSDETTTNKSYFSTANTDYLDCGPLTDLGGLTEMTIEFWYKASTQSTQKRIIYQDENNDNRMIIGTGDLALTDDLVVNIGNTAVWVADEMTTGEWIFWTVSYNGAESNQNRIKIYKNGIPQTTISTGTIPTQIPTINATMNLGFNIKDDYLDEVSFLNYEKEYTLDEFGSSTIILNNCQLFCGPSVIAYYNMQQDPTDGIFTDMSNMNDATINSNNPIDNQAFDTPILNCYND